MDFELIENLIFLSLTNFIMFVNKSNAMSDFDRIRSLETLKRKQKYFYESFFSFSSLFR